MDKEKKEKDDNIFIINASNFRNNILENIKITELDQNYNLINTTVAERAKIDKKLWVLNDVKIYSEEKKPNIKKIKLLINI